MPSSESEITDLVERLNNIEEELNTDIRPNIRINKDFHNRLNEINSVLGDIKHDYKNNGRVDSEEMNTNLQRLDRDLNILRRELENGVGKEDWQELESTLSQIRNIREALSSVVEEELDNKIVREFQNRRKELAKSLRWWKAWSIVSVVGLFLTTGFLYFDISNSDTVHRVVLSKILLLSPILVTVWFSFHQYNKHKSLIEQYEFKTSMADSLMGFREILREDFSEEDQDRVGEFVVMSVNKIYMEPGDSLGANNGTQNENTQTVPQSNLDLIRKLGN